MQGTPSVNVEKNRVLALANANRLIDAKELCSRLCEAHRSDAELRLYLGAINGQLGQFAESEACMCQVIILNPGHPGAYYNLGLALSEQGENERGWTQALQIFRKPLSIRRHEDAALHVKHNCSTIYFQPRNS